MGVKKVAVASGKTGFCAKVPVVFQSEEGKSDPLALKGEFLNFCLKNDMRDSFGVGPGTKVEDLMLFRYDAEFDCELIVLPNEGITHLQKDLIMKVKPTTATEGK